MTTLYQGYLIEKIWDDICNNRCSQNCDCETSSCPMSNLWEELEKVCGKAEDLANQIEHAVSDPDAFDDYDDERYCGISAYSRYGMFQC